jgi:hypothetical protein
VWEQLPLGWERYIFRWILLGFWAIQLTYLQLGFKVAYYDVEADKDMRLYIGKVVNATKTEVELFTERQMQNCIKEFRQVVREEVQDQNKIGDGAGKK